MSESKNQIPEAENPLALTGLKKGAIKKVAAGIPAVVSSFQKTVEEAGLSRGMKALWSLNKKGGFDCPSCAWPDPDDERSGIAEYCENGARAVADEATAKKLTPDFFEKNSVESLSKLSDYEIGLKGRIAQPMYLPSGATHYKAISWESAFKKIGFALNTLKSPEEAIFYTSGRTSNEAAFLYQLFVRAYGTNNLPDCSNMCHESSGVALGDSLGIGKGSVTLDDFNEAEVIVILGQNPGTNHPRMLTALQKAKARGAQIVSINPLPETGLMGFNNPQTIRGVLGLKPELTDLFLPVKINGDLALLQATAKLLLEQERLAPGTVFDPEFINQNTEGYQAWMQNIDGVDVASYAEMAGLSLLEVEKFAKVLQSKKKIITCWAMGLTQHKNAVDTIKEVINLLLVKGSIGKPGAGTCPVRGHSNVQGDRTMGIYEKPSKAFLDSIQRTFGFEPPRAHGYDTVDSIKAMHEGKASVFIAMGGNFLSATPDTLYTAEALRNCTLTVHVSTKLNRSHLVHGQEALILPCLGRSDKDATGIGDQFVSCENSMGVVQLSKGVLAPISDQLMSEPAIVCGIAKATLSKKTIDWNRYVEDYDVIREDIAKCITGFENYNEKVRLPGGFYLPNCTRDGRFDTPTAKAKFHVAKPTQSALAPGELMMMTIRSHDQYNTTIYGLNDRYRGIYNERRVVLLNKTDMDDQGLAEGDLVDLINQADGRTRTAHRFVVVSYPIPKGCCATYFPEANVLVPIGSVADHSNTPVSKNVIITLAKA
ncbi:molybdopterin-dependent oxidoreductase alpha subunit [Dyadobacter jejuensis]|uniref:Molybdopterin-dependent oxidoreductase alpha subunit n=1 Tax=Dyadobacter jejuensis TaxID=1082580 RepID=A0A316AM10_9BACT|nr:FdhF/YdeP family oxidoreductase [Dyadobacter jejuensis]PWJ58309.1 molybdopterin-dependent oxidoreductase alpha subunit [Dyadobacter jejuensis]